MQFKQEQKFSAECYVTAVSVNRKWKQYPLQSPLSIYISKCSIRLTLLAALPCWPTFVTSLCLCVKLLQWNLSEATNDVLDEETLSCMLMRIHHRLFYYFFCFFFICSQFYHAMYLIIAVGTSGLTSLREQ